MRHTIGLFHGQSGASYWKRYLSENMCVRDADVQKIDHIMDKIKYNNVERRVGLICLIQFYLINILFIFLMIITAFPVGFFAGLFGIGGGLITVPFLFFIFEALGIDKNYLMHLAVGTSFAIIIPTSMVSVYTHNKHKSVDPNIVKTYGLFVVIGVLLGTTFAAMAKTKSLVVFFTVVVFCFRTYLLINSNQQTISKNKFKLHFRIIFGLISGFISAPMGIGGAVMNVPILKYFGYPIKKAIGSAATIGFIIALCGAIGFLYSGSILDLKLTT